MKSSSIWDHFAKGFILSLPLATLVILNYGAGTHGLTPYLMVFILLTLPGSLILLAADFLAAFAGGGGALKYILLTLMALSILNAHFMGMFYAWAFAKKRNSPPKIFWASSSRECPKCKKTIPIKATKCSFCSSTVIPLYAADPSANKQIIQILSMHSSGLSGEHIAIHLNRTAQPFLVDGSEWDSDKVNGVISQFSANP
jgi:hypothetical protein